MASLFRALARTPLLSATARPCLVSPLRTAAPSSASLVRHLSFASPSAPLSLRTSHGASSLFASSTLHTPFALSPAVRSLASPANKTQRRFNSLQPKKMKYRKKHKGRIPIPIGGSTKGTYIEFGEYGLRIKEGARLTAKQIQAAHTTIRRKIKTVKGSQIWTRVFPDIPVTSKGGESRMGKGKGSVDYFATRVGRNRIIFEIGGGGIRREHAKEALRLAAAKMPVAVEFVVKSEQIKPPKVVHAIHGAPSPAAKTASPLASSSSSAAAVTPPAPVPAAVAPEMTA